MLALLHDMVRTSRSNTEFPQDALLYCEVYRSLLIGPWFAKLGILLLDSLDGKEGLDAELYNNERLPINPTDAILVDYIIGDSRCLRNIPWVCFTLVPWLIGTLTRWDLPRDVSDGFGLGDSCWINRGNTQSKRHSLSDEVRVPCFSTDSSQLEITVRLPRLSACSNCSLSLTIHGIGSAFNDGWAKLIWVKAVGPGNPFSIIYIRAFSLHSGVITFQLGLRILRVCWCPPLCSPAFWIKHVPFHWLSPLQGTGY